MCGKIVGILSQTYSLVTVTVIVVLTVVMYDSRLIWCEPVPTHAISTLHWWLWVISVNFRVLHTANVLGNLHCVSKKFPPLNSL